MTNAVALSSPSVSLPPVTYKGLPVCTTEMLADAYGCPAKNIRMNFAHNRDRFVEGKHFIAITNVEIKDFTLQVKTFGLQISPKTRHLTLWLERGAARHAKMLNTDKAWDVFELLEETFFRVAKPEALASDAPITPGQQCTLQAIVKAKIEALPGDKRRNRTLFPKAWGMFNNHFQLARYCQLPQSRMSEAVAYLTQMELTPAKALPAAEPAAPAIPSDDRHFAVAAELRAITRRLEQLRPKIAQANYPRFCNRSERELNRYEMQASLYRMGNASLMAAIASLTASWQVWEMMK